MSFDQESNMSRIKLKKDESSSNIRTEQSRKRSESIKNEELRRIENSAKKLKKKPTRRGDQKNSFRQQFQQSNRTPKYTAKSKRQADS